MKDYKLSEVKNICDKNNGDCRVCELAEHIWYTNTYQCPLSIKPFSLKIDKEEKNEHR